MIATETRSASILIPSDVARAIGRSRLGYFLEIRGGHCSLLPILDSTFAIYWHDDSVASEWRGFKLTPDHIAAARSGVALSLGDLEGIEGIAIADPTDSADLHYLSDNLRESLALANQFTDTESSRFALGGVAITRSLGMVATDGRRLVSIGGDSSADGGATIGIVPSVAIDSALRLAGARGSVERLTVGPFSAVLSVVGPQGERRAVRTRLIEGRFPRWFDCIDLTREESFRGPVRLLSADERRSLLARRKVAGDDSVGDYVGPALLDMSFVAPLEPFANDVSFASEAADKPVHFRGSIGDRPVVAVVMPLSRDKRPKNGGDDPSADMVERIWREIVEAGATADVSVGDMLAADFGASVESVRAARYWNRPEPKRRGRPRKVAAESTVESVATPDPVAESPAESADLVEPTAADEPQVESPAAPEAAPEAAPTAPADSDAEALADTLARLCREYLSVRFGQSTIPPASALRGIARRLRDQSLALLDSID